MIARPDQQSSEKPVNNLPGKRHLEQIDIKEGGFLSAGCFSSPSYPMKRKGIKKSTENVLMTGFGHFDSLLNTHTRWGGGAWLTWWFCNHLATEDHRSFLDRKSCGSQSCGSRLDFTCNCACHKAACLIRGCVDLRNAEIKPCHAYRSCFAFPQASPFVAKILFSNPLKAPHHCWCHFGARIK